MVYYLVRSYITLLFEFDIGAQKAHKSVTLDTLNIRVYIVLIVILLLWPHAPTIVK